MGTQSKFVVIEHRAKKAGLHYDLRFKKPTGKKWASFAVPKGIPLKVGQKVLAIRTNDHSEKDATFTGSLEKGYGAGIFKRHDGGSCIIEKFSDNHIAVNFKGSKMKGLYHLVSTVVVGRKKRTTKEKTFFLFKGKR